MSKKKKRFRPLRSISELKEGDIVRSVAGRGYIVTANYGGHATAVRTVDVSNPVEWHVLREEGR